MGLNHPVAHGLSDCINNMVLQMAWLHVLPISTDERHVFTFLIL